MFDIQTARLQMPSCEHGIHLNHAGVSPIPLASGRAMHEYLDDLVENGPKNLHVWRARMNSVRGHFGTLLGVNGNDVALMRSTTHGILCVANVFPWQSGDNVVTTEVEFPANFYPWLSLGWKGVETRTVAPREDGSFTIDDFAHAVDKRTRILAVSFVEYGNGFRHDLPKLSQLCADRDIFLCVDLIQGAGAIQVDLRALNIHMAAGAVHKWLLGPEGFGFLYCSPELVGRLLPAMLGWFGVEDPLRFTDMSIDRIRKDARRFEEAPPSPIDALGTEQSLTFLQNVGVDKIEARIKMLTDELVERLQGIGATIHSLRVNDTWSGIVACSLPHLSSAEAVARLAKENITTVVRNNLLRLSPHFYNTTDEMRYVVDLLRQ